MILVAILAAASAAAVAFLFVSRATRERSRIARAAIEREAELLRSAGQAEAESAKKQVELDARTAAQETRRTVEEELRAIEDAAANRALELEGVERGLQEKNEAIGLRVEALSGREDALKLRDDATHALHHDHECCVEEHARMLERIAGESAGEIKSRLFNEWIEEARAAAAEKVRRVEAGVNDPEHVRTAKRLMDISIMRYQGHYLTERLLTNVPIVPASLPRIFGESNVNLQAIEEVSHVKLEPSETQESIRLEGQDSFGREIARRAIAQFARAGIKPGEAKKACEGIAEQLEREVFELGKRAFKELEIPRAHPDIVRLVGKLNYRTSYTQNQWKHAVEAAFLCGMIAYEMGLDVKTARRAALMHDMGKALTHEIDGSHAVIGAELARRLGETEIVANAIGAHHTDEPFNSVYAYLVAASDAMSGGRPGARRQQDDNYAERLDDLQRIASGFAGVDKVYPVFGGREVRVYVQENRISDKRAVELSTEIATKIADEMTFPGQIKVTVIREVRAVEVAG